MELDFEKENGLIPAIVQDHRNGEVLMLGFMNQEALTRTRQTGFVTFYSRSRKKLWTKGESSGQRLLLRELRIAFMAAPKALASSTARDGRRRIASDLPWWVRSHSPKRFASLCFYLSMGPADVTEIAVAKRYQFVAHANSPPPFTHLEPERSKHGSRAMRVSLEQRRLP